MEKKYENLLKIQQNTQNFNFLDPLYWDWSIVWVTLYAYWSYWKGSWDGPNASIFSEILFQDLTFSGIALLIVNEITNIVASIFLFLASAKLLLVMLQSYLAEEMDELLNVKHSNFRSIQCKTGKFKEL